jgi:hypothetical protein
MHAFGIVTKDLVPFSKLAQIIIRLSQASDGAVQARERSKGMWYRVISGARKQTGICGTRSVRYTRVQYIENDAPKFSCMKPQFPLMKSRCMKTPVVPVNY